MWGTPTLDSLLLIVSCVFWFLVDCHTSLTRCYPVVRDSLCHHGVTAVQWSLQLCCPSAYNWHRLHGFPCHGHRYRLGCGGQWGPGGSDGRRSWWQTGTWHQPCCVSREMIYSFLTLTSKKSLRFKLFFKSTFCVCLVLSFTCFREIRSLPDWTVLGRLTALNACSSDQNW